MGSVDFHWHSLSLRLFVVASALLGLLGLPMMASDALDMRLAGIVWSLGFLWLLWALVRRWRSTDPVVSVDSNGVLDRRIATAPYAWNEIRNIEIFEADNMTWVGLEFIDPRASLEKSGWLVRLCAFPQRLMRFPSVSISMALLDGTPGDLVAAMRTFRPDLIGES